MFAFLAQIGIGSIVGKIAEAYKAREDAKTDQARIAADADIAALNAQKDALVAEARWRLNTIARAFLMAPVGIYLWKVVVWDKVLALGSTDDLSSNLWFFVWVVAGFYFVHSIVGRRSDA